MRRGGNLMYFCRKSGATHTGAEQARAGAVVPNDEPPRLIL